MKILAFVTFLVLNSTAYGAGLLKPNSFTTTPFNKCKQSLIIGEDREDCPPKYLLVPGIYSGSYSSKTEGYPDSGFELSILRNDTTSLFGSVIGGNSNSTYFELELWMLIALGAGARFEKNQTVPQFTISLPIFFVFPYWRQIWYKEDIKFETGMMIKFPLSF
jgi:hypothetical protein